MSDTTPAPPDGPPDRPAIEPSPVLREVGDMLTFAIAHPDRSQVPLAHRGHISQQDWDTLSDAEQSRLQTNRPR